MANRVERHSGKVDGESEGCCVGESGRSGTGVDPVEATTTPSRGMPHLHTEGRYMTLIHYDAGTCTTGSRFETAQVYRRRDVEATTTSTSKPRTRRVRFDRLPRDLRVEWPTQSACRRLDSSPTKIRLLRGGIGFRRGERKEISAVRLCYSEFSCAKITSSFPATCNEVWGGGWCG